MQQKVKEIDKQLISNKNDQHMQKKQNIQTTLQKYQFIILKCLETNKIQMIRHQVTQPFQEKKHIYFPIDQKKLVKTFIYHNNTEWQEYFTGFLFMEPNQYGKVDLKIRFSRHPHMGEIQAGIRLPLELFTDEQGLYTVIQQSVIKTVQKPEQSLLYLKIGPEGKILAISFHSKSYCKALLEHLTLVLENNESDEMTWNEENLQFLNVSMKENLMYVDSVFILEERIVEFCQFFNKVDKKLYENKQKSPSSEDERYMVQFFEIIKNVFLRANEKIITMFISDQYNFETVLKCLSYNPFGVYNFNYLDEYKRLTVINSSIGQFANSEFQTKIEIIAKVKFLRDVAICTFIEIPTDGVFNLILNRTYVEILEALGNPKGQVIEKIQQLSRKDEYTFLCTFSQIWQVFKTVMEDSQTMIIKQIFYLNWVQNGMFSETLSAMGRLLRQKQIADIHPRFWQKWMESMNPMLSYEWNESQKMVLHHAASINPEDSSDFMNSLVLILANCDSNTKTFILDFVRVQIQLSENRKHVTAKYMSYLYNNFVTKSFEYCNNEEDIQNYIEFLQKIYTAEPIRTRHFMVETNLMSHLKVYFKNKFVFIMLLKLLKTFIEVGDNDTFRYLSTGDFYNSVREKYILNKHTKNVTNSLFLSIFKSVASMQNKEGRKYLYRIFFDSELESEQIETENLLNSQESLQKTYKRPMPVQGFPNEMEMEK